MKIQASIAELKRFAPEVIRLFRPARNSQIVAFQDKFNLRLPSDFIKFLCFSNGVELGGNEVYGITSARLDLTKVYTNEHFKVSVPIFPHYVPFSPDGGGNYYCLDTSSIGARGLCPVKFWVSNSQYVGKLRPETTHASFSQWLKKCLIDWTLEDINYDGSPR